MEAVEREKSMNEPQPSAEALALAVKLSEHTQCAVGLAVSALGEETICADCFGDARTIDHDLQLPQRNAVFLAAQRVVDSARPFGDRNLAWIVQTETWNTLRDALAQIKTP